MEQKLTLEQAAENVALVCEKFFIGKKQEHLVLEESLRLIADALKKVGAADDGRDFPKAKD